MSAADALITRDGPVNVPMDYVVPNSAAITPLLVSATFTDPTNAGPYVPAFEIVTPDGRILGPFPLNTPIAAGGSARVSWFRGVTPLPSSSAVLPATSVSRLLTSQSIPNATATKVSFDTVNFDDLGWFNAGTPNQLVVGLSGQYLCTFVLAWVYPAGGGFPIQGVINQLSGATTSSVVSQQIVAQASTPNVTFGANVVNAAVGDVFTMVAYQGSGGSMSTWIPGSAGPDIQPVPTLTVTRIGDRH